MSRLDPPSPFADDPGSLPEFETLIFELSSRFINLAPGEVDGEIENALRRVCAPLGVDRALLWQWQAATPDVIRPTHGYFAQESLRAAAEPLNQDLFPWVIGQMRAGRTVVVPDVDKAPEEAAVDRENARLRGIQSNLCLPLSVAGEPPLGALSLSALTTRREWPDALVRRLQLVAQIFAVALARQRAEEARRVREARLSTAAELAGLGFYELDLGRRTLFVDDRFRDLCALPPEPLRELEGMQFWLEHVHPDDLRRVMVQREGLLSGRLAQLSIEYRYLHPTRGELWLLHLSRSVERDTMGRTIRTAGGLRDITEQKRGESERRDLSQRLIRAHEEERAMLARELHDDLTQRLAVLAIEVGRAELTAPEPSQAKLMRSVRQSLVRLSRDVHTLATQLHPSVLDELGLGEALRAEAERIGRQGRIAVSVEVAALPDAIDKDVALCLFRVAQGAMSNVIRHARARSVSVRLQPREEGLQLVVRDDGVGFDAASPRSKASLGLASMLERVRLANGSLEIESAPGRGTTVAAWVPVETASP